VGAIVIVYPSTVVIAIASPSAVVIAIVSPSLVVRTIASPSAVVIAIVSPSLVVGVITFPRIAMDNKSKGERNSAEEVELEWMHPVEVSFFLEFAPWCRKTL
jgi:hypothetical protein